MEISQKNILQPENWVKNYANQLYRYLLFRVKYNETAEDLLQETFMAALNAMSNFNGESSERTWLFAIMKNKLADYYRKYYKQSLSENISDEDFLEHFFDSEDNDHFKNEHKALSFNNIEESLSKNEFDSVLENCLKKVPSKSSTVFILKYLEELDSKEICNELQISEANFWTMMHRAKLILRECVEKNWLV